MARLRIFLHLICINPLSVSQLTYFLPSFLISLPVHDVHTAHLSVCLSVCLSVSPSALANILVYTRRCIYVHKLYLPAYMSTSYMPDSMYEGPNLVGIYTGSNALDLKHQMHMGCSSSSIYSMQYGQIWVYTPHIQLAIAYLGIPVPIARYSIALAYIPLFSFTKVCLRYRLTGWLDLVS